MAVELNCSACEEIRQEVPELIANGFDDNMCASLKNNSGLKASSGHNDCTDLNNLTDCLIGNMDTEIDDYDSCSWKDFMKKFIPNVWTVLKAMVCAICGIWERINALQPCSGVMMSGSAPSVTVSPGEGVFAFSDPMITFPSAGVFTGWIQCRFPHHAQGYRGLDGFVDTGYVGASANVATAPDNDTVLNVPVTCHVTQGSGLVARVHQGSPDPLTVTNIECMGYFIPD